MKIETVTISDDIHIDGYGVFGAGEYRVEMPEYYVAADVTATAIIHDDQLVVVEDDEEISETDKSDAREKIIRALCEEQGSWGDGSAVTDESMRQAAEDPGSYDIDEADLDGAVGGDVAAIVRLRAAWGLSAL